MTINEILEISTDAQEVKRLCKEGNVQITRDDVLKFIRDKTTIMKMPEIRALILQHGTDEQKRDMAAEIMANVAGWAQFSVGMQDEIEESVRIALEYFPAAARKRREK